MGRSRTRVALESGSRLNLAKLIPSGHGKPGFRRTAVWRFGDGTDVQASVSLWGGGRHPVIGFRRSKADDLACPSSSQFRRRPMVRHLSGEETMDEGALPSAWRLDFLPHGTLGGGKLP